MSEQPQQPRAGKALVIWICVVGLLGVGIWFGFGALLEDPEESIPHLRTFFRVPSDQGPPVVLSGMIHDEGMQGFLGADACKDCHADKYDTFLETAHARTSAPANKDTIRGHFTGDQRVLRTKEPELTFEMRHDGKSWFQRAVAKNDTGLEDWEEKFDIVTGSGKIAQTFLYFRDRRVLELPVSYLRVSDTWVNSPGYVDGEADFSREVSIGCLECHSTCVTSNTAYPENSDQPYRFLFGISCERCHGPGKQHVEFHRANPDAQEARHVINPAGLSQRRQLDVCAQCHGGEPEGYLSSGFTYRPGEPLQTHVRFRNPSEGDKVGVHSTNQAARLAKSPCYQKSEGMTCTTCHNPHVFERGDLVTFSNRCMTCHESHECGVSGTLGDVIKTNCIDCHVPTLEDLGTPFALPDGSTYHPRMRDHVIGVYPKLSEKLMAAFEKADKQAEGADDDDK